MELTGSGLLKTYGSLGEEGLTGPFCVLKLTGSGLLKTYGSLGGKDLRVLFWFGNLRASRMILRLTGLFGCLRAILIFCFADRLKNVGYCLFDDSKILSGLRFSNLNLLNGCFWYLNGLFCIPNGVPDFILYEKNRSESLF